MGSEGVWDCGQWEDCVWGRLVNTDFSAMVKQHGNLNSKNDVVWTHSREEGGEVLEFTQEKFDESFMMDEPQRLGAFRCSSVRV